MTIATHALSRTGASILIVGPSGCGKTMMASRLPGPLAVLDYEQDPSWFDRRDVEIGWPRSVAELVSHLLALVARGAEVAPRSVVIEGWREMLMRMREQTDASNVTFSDEARGHFRSLLYAVSELSRSGRIVVLTFNATYLGDFVPELSPEAQAAFDLVLYLDAQGARVVKSRFSYPEVGETVPDFDLRAWVDRVNLGRASLPPCNRDIQVSPAMNESALPEGWHSPEFALSRRLRSVFDSASFSRREPLS